MTGIPISNLDSGSDSPRQARPDLLTAINALNAIYSPSTGGLSTAAVISAVQGAISESELNTTLGQRINLIDAPEQTANSVAARIKAAADALSLTVTAEATARAAAVSSATAASAAALDAAVSTLLANINDEAVARANAVTAEAIARGNALTAEALARGAAITTAASTLQDSINSIADTVTTLTTGLNQVNIDLSSAVETLTSSITDANSTSAESIDTLASQVRGTYTGTDPNLLTSGLLYTVARTAADANTALSRRVDSLSASVSGQQLDAAVAWQFDTTVEGWTGNGAPSQAGGYLVPANHATDPYVVSPEVSVDAAQYALVRVRVRKVGSPVWVGQLRWTHDADTSFGDDRLLSLPEPVWDDSNIGYVSVHVTHNLWSGTITGLRFDFSVLQTPSIGYTIDWVAVGRPAPGASSAQLVAEQTARAAADTAEATQRQTLSTVITGVADPSSATLATLSAGLIFDERTARVFADNSEVIQRQSLAAKLTGVNDPSSVTLATLSAGLIFDESTARVAADTAEATQRQTLSAKLTGVNDPSGVTLSSVSSGLIFEERTARVAADAAEVTQRQTLSAVLLGVNDPTTVTHATLASGIVHEEKTARVSAVNAVVDDVNTLTAAVSNVRRWSNTQAGVTASVNVALKMRDGATNLQTPDALFGAMSRGAIDYYVEARPIATNVAAFSAAVFTATYTAGAWAWSVRIISETGQSGNNVKFFVNNNVPTLTLYSTPNPYSVLYQVEARVAAYSSEAAILDEATARADADSAEAVKRQTLSVKVTGLTDPASATLGTLASGLIYDESTARVGADNAEVARREALSVKVTGVADPATATLGTLSSGLIYEEVTARVAAVSSAVQRISQLEAVSSQASTTPTFFESWAAPTPLGQWTVTGSGEASIVSVSDAVSGGRVLRVGNNAGNDQIIAVSKHLSALSTTGLLKLTIVARRTAGSGLLTAGFTAYGSDGATPITPSGANAPTPYYVGINGVAPTASWGTYYAYFKLGTTAGGAGTLASPYTFRAESRYVAATLQPNATNGSGTIEINSVQVSELSAELVAHESSITTLNTQVGDSTSGNSALASRATALETTVNSPISGVAATSTALDTVKLLVNDASKGNNALATRTAALESTVNNGVTGLAATRASIQLDYSTTAAMNTAIATAVNTVSARLNTGGDTYNSIVAAQADASAGKESGITNAAAITNVQSWIQTAGTNLTINSSFEVRATADGTKPAGWGITATLPATLTLGAGRTGGQAARVSITGATTDPTYISNYSGNILTSPLSSVGVLGGWKANTSYVLSFYAKKVSGAAFTKAVITWGTAPATTTPILEPTLQTTWQRYAFLITWGASVQANGTIYIGHGGSSAAGDEFWLDDVQVEEGTTLSGYAPGLGDGVGMVAAVQTETTTRATETGYLGSQYTVRMTAGNVAGGFGLSGTSAAGQGGTIDFGVRANTFFIAPPEGSSVTTNVYPFTVYTTVTTLPSGVVVQPGVYMKSAFVDYISASQIDTKGITIKDSSGNVVFSASVPLDYSRISTNTLPGAVNLVNTSWGTPGGTIAWGVMQDGPLAENSIVLAAGYNGQSRSLYQCVASAFNKCYTPDVSSSLSFWFDADTTGVTASVSRDSANGWTADGSTTYSGSCFAVTKTALSVNSAGIACRAVSVTAGETLRIRVRVRGSTATASGLNVRVNESTAAVLSGAVTSANRTSSTVLLNNGAATSTYTTYSNLTYVVPAGVVAVSLAVYSSANGPVTLYVDDPCINRAAYTDSLVGPRKSTDGGFYSNTARIAIDPTKPYRFVIPFKRLDSLTAALVFGSEPGDLCDLNTSTIASSNPYFAWVNTTDVTPGQWYAVVAFAFPWIAGGPSMTNASAGVYNLSTGAKVLAGVNFSWPSTASSVGLRTLQWAADEGATTVFDLPVVHAVDGSEPPLRSFFADSTQLNSSVSLAADGTLSGAGGGQVTITGLGYQGDLNATSGATLLNGNFETSVTGWTHLQTGSPATIATISGVSTVTDSVLGVCGQYSAQALGSAISTKAVFRPEEGKVYKVTAVFSFVSIPDGSTSWNLLLAPMTSAYAINGTLKLSPEVAFTAIGGTRTLVAKFSTTAGYDIQIPTGTTYLRAGLRCGTAEASPVVVNVKSVIVEEVTDVTLAQADATSALSKLTDFANDNVLTALEKQATKLDWDVIVNEKTGISAQAASLGITAEDTAYSTAYTALSAYVTPLLADLTASSAIVGTTFRSTFAALYNARQALLNKIAAVAATTATWSSVSGIPYETIFNNDDSVSLGFNPTFDWPVGQSYPTGWSNWSGVAPTRETSIVKIGTASVKYAASGVNVGMQRDVRLSTPLPAGTFVAGSIDMRLEAYTSGKPLILVDLYTASDWTTYVRQTIEIPSTTTGVWQRTPWSTRVGSAQRVYGIRIYCMGCYSSGPSGAFTGTVIFDNLRFMLADSTIDNKAITLSETSGTVTITGAGGGSFTAITPNNKINNGNVSTYITAGSIGNAYIGNFIQSNTFDGVVDASGNITNVGTAGWCLGKAGQMVVDAAHVRGKLTASQISVGASSYSKTSSIAAAYGNNMLFFTDTARNGYVDLQSNAPFSTTETTYSFDWDPTPIGGTSNAISLAVISGSGGSADFYVTYASVKRIKQDSYSNWVEDSGELVLQGDPGQYMHFPSKVNTWWVHGSLSTFSSTPQGINVAKSARADSGGIIAPVIALSTPYGYYKYRVVVKVKARLPSEATSSGLYIRLNWGDRNAPFFGTGGFLGQKAYFHTALDTYTPVSSNGLSFSFGLRLNLSTKDTTAVPLVADLSELRLAVYRTVDLGSTTTGPYYPMATTSPRFLGTAINSSWAGTSYGWQRDGLRSSVVIRDYVYDASLLGNKGSVLVPIEGSYDLWHSVAGSANNLVQPGVPLTLFATGNVVLRDFNGNLQNLIMTSTIDGGIMWTERKL